MKKLVLIILTVILAGNIFAQKGADSLGCNADFFIENYPPGSLTLSVSNYSSGEITNYYWDFGDGTIDFTNLSGGTHVYTSAGLFQVCLVTYDTVTGCESYKCQEIMIGNDTSACGGSFTYQAGSGNTIIFNANPMGFVTNYYWEFGDGAYTYSNQAVHTFDQPGYYLVTMIVGNDAGCSYVYEEYIIVGTPAPNDCEAKFTVYPEAGTTDAYFSNNAMGSSITSSYWDFGDGEISEEYEPLHHYTNGGYYDVCLTVMDTTSALGCYNTSCQTVRIGNDPNACNAAFTYQINEATKTVTLNDNSFGNPISWFWWFEDGTISTLQNPTHTFANTGFYLIGLNINNSSGCNSDAYEYLNVGAGDLGLECGFNYDLDTVGKAGNYLVKFDGAVFGDAAKITWNFGDGTTEHGTLSPTHTYTGKGIYTATLSVEDPIIGESDNYSRIINTSSSVNNIFSSQLAVEISPNPVKNSATIFINTPSEMDVQFEIYDIVGNKIRLTEQKHLNAGDNRIRWNRDNISCGIYYFEIKTSTETITRKLVITE